jgi:hypothetical protein
VDIARYRATLQALTAARLTAARALLSGRLDEAEREEWHWLLDLLDSIERTSGRLLREDIVIGGARSPNRR